MGYGCSKVCLGSRWGPIGWRSMAALLHCPLRFAPFSASAPTRLPTLTLPTDLPLPPSPHMLQLEKKAKKGGRSEFGKSAKVFGMIQQHMDGTTAAARAQAAEAAAPLAAHLKL